MVDKVTADQILNKIVSSKHITSEIDHKILSYLVNATLENRNLKEIDMAIELFDRDEDFNPVDDSIVRSHIYSLRKKLETYYLTEGVVDKIQLVLPKGRYRVDFFPKTKDIKITSQTRKRTFISYIFIVILAFISVYLWIENFKLKDKSELTNLDYSHNPIWSDFLNSPLSTILVIGDYYVFQQPYKLGERERFIRDVKINSGEDFIKYLNEHPEEKTKYEETPLTYLGGEVPQVVISLAKVFKTESNKLKIKMASDLVWQDIQDNNIIFVGSVKTMRQLNYFFDQLRFKITLFPHRIFYTPNYSDTTNTISLESYYRHGFHNDFSIVAKCLIGNNNFIMLFISFSFFGKVETVKKLTDPAFQNDLLTHEYITDTMPTYFEVLFKVHGVEKSGFTTEILYFHEINGISIE